MKARLKKLASKADVIVTGGSEFYKSRLVYVFWIAWTIGFAISAAWRHDLLSVAIQIGVGVMNIGFLYRKPLPGVPGEQGEPGPQGPPAYQLTRRRLLQMSERMSQLSQGLVSNPTPTEMVNTLDELRGMIDELAGKKQN